MILLGIFDNWTASHWALAITLVSIIITTIITARNLIAAVREMKPEVKKIPVIDKTVSILEKTLDNIGIHMSKIESKIDATLLAGISKSNSPRVLNDIGKKLLSESGIGKIIDDHKEWIFQKVKQINPPNSYRAEQAVILAVEELGMKESLINKIEESAYQTGSPKEVILLAGAIYIRDEILKRLNMNPSDIDNHAPKE